MNANLRNFALWVIIVLLLLALFTLFQNPGQRTAAQDISFSQLLSEVDQGRVRDPRPRPSAEHRLEVAHVPHPRPQSRPVPLDPRLRLDVRVPHDLCTDQHRRAENRDGR